MKYKLMGLFAFVAAILFAIIISFTVKENEDKGRFHQHLEIQTEKECKNHMSNEFCTHLPIVSIETNGVAIPGSNTGALDMFNENISTKAENGEPMVKVSVSVYDKEAKNNHLTDKPTFTTDSLIRVRGHASREFEKAPYLLKFVDENGLDNDIEVMGMDAHNEWVLNGPFLDKTLVRNYMWYNISGEIMEYAPNVRFCEVFLDGDYRGIYLMVENLTSGKNSRLKLTVTEKDTTVSGYLYRIDRISEEDLGTTREIFPFSERTNHSRTDIALRYPGKTNLTDELAKEIEFEISQFEKAVYSYDYDSDKYGCFRYADINNAADYFLICEMTKNMDMGRYSTFIYKRPNEKYRFCVWDFNNCCDNFPTDITGFADFSITDKSYFEMFIRDEAFTEAVIERYRQYRKTYFSDEYMMNYIDETIKFLGPAIERNSARWASYIESDEALFPSDRNVHSNKEAVVAYKSFLISRGNWLDENIDTILQFSAESKVKQYNEVTE